MVGTVEGGQSQKAGLGCKKKKKFLQQFYLSCKITVFNSPVSVEVEEKCECLSDVVWSALPICHLNYEIVKIFARPGACEFSVYGRKPCQGCSAYTPL